MINELIYLNINIFSKIIHKQFSKYLKNSVVSFLKILYNIEKASEVISMKENSYTELMKSAAMNRKRTQEAYVLNLYIDMTISEALLKAALEAIRIKIDKALDEQDKETFHVLAKQYKELIKQFGT